MSLVLHRRSSALALVLLCSASLVAVLDLTIVALALPSIRTDLRFSTGGAQWILTAYVVAFAGLLLVMGRVGDLYGRRRLFMLGLVLFAASSLLAGLAWSPWLLIAARAFQGMSGAALVPTSMALISATFPAGERRDSAFGTYGAMAGLGLVVGMVAGGVITEFFGWRWVFLVNVPIVLGVLVLAPTAIAESRDEGARRGLDVPGAISATLGFAALVFAIGELPARGAGSFLPTAAAIAGVALIGGFILRQRRAPAPILPLHLLRERSVAVPNIAGALLSVVGAGQLYILTLYFQDVLGRSPLHAGFLFTPMTLASVITSPVAGRMTSRIGARQTAAIGFAMIAIGLGIVVARMETTGALATVLAGTVIAEAGIMCASVALTIAALARSGAGEHGLESGILTTSRELGNAVGFAAVAGIVANVAMGSTGASPAAGDLVTGLRWSLALTIAAAVIALPFVLAGMPRNRDSRSDAHRTESLHAGSLRQKRG